ncbi:hypothetical protein GGH19_005127 [Coemansia sp. RSA 1807]|nr:hypothetical protein GGH19_005127 [Coemansia sp. RSA 1807]
MEFSDLYKQSNSALAQFSPDGRFIAVAVEHRLIVRDSENPKRIHAVFSTPYTVPFVQQVEWSRDSRFVFTASFAQSRVDVWAPDDVDWRCAITDEVARVERAVWSPDSLHVLTFSELDLRLSVWSLIDGDERKYVQFPKMQAGVSFHPDGEFAAVAQRRDLRDYIGVYSTQDWRLVRELALDTADVQGMRWSPDGLHIVAWDTSASFVVQVLNVGGAVKRSVQPADAGLGVRTCVWSPNGQFVVLGGYDGRLHVLSSLTWRAVATLEPKPHISIPTDVFCETELPRALSASRIHTRFDLATIPCMLKTGGKSHKTCVEFSADGSLLCAVNESMPCTVWVWQVRTMRVSAIIQTLHPVRVCVWSPVENVLVFATGAASVYLWRENRGCHLFEIPAASVAVGGVVWNPNGDGMAVLSKGLFAMAYITDQTEPE